MSDSESDYYKSTSSIEKNKATPKSAGDNKKRKPRSPNSVPPSKKPTTDSDIFGVRNQEAGTISKEDGHQLTSYFVNRVGNGCERRVAVTEGAYYVDVKVYKTEDARSSDSLELWKKALVRIKFQADSDALQWKSLQKFVKTADSLFTNPPRFYDK